MTGAARAVCAGSDGGDAAVGVGVDGDVIYLSFSRCWLWPSTGTTRATTSVGHGDQFFSLCRPDIRIYRIAPVVA